MSSLYLGFADPRLRTEVRENVRSLVERVEVVSGSVAAEIVLVGDIAAMVELAHGPERKKAAPVGAALSATDMRSVKVVAGARNHRDRNSLVVTI
jgi:hypothetical protein